MTNTTTADTKAPLTRDGQELEVYVGRVSISLVRVTATEYRVVTLDAITRERIACWCTEFTADAIPGDMTVEEAAREFARHGYRTFHADFETTTQVAERASDARAEQAPTVKLQPAAKGTATKVSDPQHDILAAAASDPAGYVRRGREATIKQLQALARRGLLDLDVAMDRRRKVVKGGTITAAGRVRLAQLRAAAQSSVALAA